jgi:tape measure domain-containing protein
MENSEFIEILSPNAEAQLRAIMPLVEQLANNIKTINGYKASSTPSGADSGIKAMNDAYKAQNKELDEIKKRLITITSLNKQRYQEEAKLIADNDKALTYQSQKELTQIKAKQAMITSLNKQKGQEAIEAQKAALANENLNRSYVKLTASREKAKNKLQDLIASESASNREIKQAQKEFDVLNKKVAAADKAVGRFSDANRKINGLTQSVGNLMTAFGIGTGLYLAVDIAKNIYETTKALQSLDLALKMVSGTSEIYASNTAFITTLSEKWGVKINGLTEQFTQFYVNAKGKLSESEIKETFEGIAKSGSLMGVSIDKQNDAFYAFNQMLSKGTVQAEELKKQLGNALPGAIKAATMAYQALHPELKVTEQMMLDQMKAGKLISSEMVPEIVKAYQKLYGIENVKNVDTLVAAQNRLSNSWTEMVRSMNESKTGGISQFFGFFLNRANEMLSVLIRANTSWDELYKKAGLQGRGKGLNIGEDRFNQGGGTVSGANAAITVAEKELAKLQKEYIENQKAGNELTDKIKNRSTIVDIADLAFQINGDQERLGHLKENKARLLEEIAIQGGILAKVKGLKRDIGKEKITATTHTKTKAEIKAELKKEKDFAKEREQLLKDEYDADLSNLERQKVVTKTMMDDEKTSLEDRLFLLEAYAFKEVQIAQLVHDEKVRLAKKEAKERKLNPEQTGNLITPIDNEFLNKQNEIIKEGLSEREKIQKSDNERTKAYYEKNPPFFIMSDADREKLNADNKLILDTKKQAFKDVARLFNEFAGDFMGKSGFSQTFDNFFKENKDGVSLFDKMFDKDSMMTTQERTLAMFMTISSAAQDTMNLIGEASQQKFDNQLARLDKEKEVAIRFAGDSTAAKTKIEEDYAKRKKKIEEKSFKARQKMAMANIAIDTAQAIMSIMSTGGGAHYLDFGASAGILTGIVTAMGIAQIAMVASQKMPEYWKGTDNAEAGLAWSNERGAEMILDKNNRIKSFGDDNGARLTMMQKGDKVKTASETKNIMFNSDLNNILTDNGIKEAKIEIVNKGLTVDEMDLVLSKHFANITTQHVSFDNNGVRQWSERNGNITTRNESRGSGKGFSV